MKLSKQHLADLFGVTVRTVSEWQRDTEFPAPTREGRRNLYDAAAVVAWWRDREIARLIEGEDGRLLDLNHERARLAKAQADRQEYALARERGELVEAAAVGEVVGDDYTRMRARLLALPTKAAAMVTPETDTAVCQRILDDLVREALNELSDPNTVYQEAV
ncbi:terminase small subunit [Spiribacter halobius]|uniref:Terminase small subunit n=1 Tax=Sediminicurvatus halobius TaxID=2182432 RepID=A0A2U2MZH3_9GAMM|nr:terminase small subunit [Spiribacter halobius]PWG62326.1 hypothetical protein DEM34_12695 [Spiribacter halobius]UEX79752.1 terminase small subunit [Spiribacter halobius]